MHCVARKLYAGNMPSYTRLQTGQMCLLTPISLLAGASFFYHGGAAAYEAQEVRAYGLFLADVEARLDTRASLAADVGSGLAALKNACMKAAARARPSFASITAQLEALQTQFYPAQ